VSTSSKRPVPARLLRTLTPTDVGSRVMVRRQLLDGMMSDVVGELAAWSEGILTIVDRHGRHVSVAEADMLAGHTVPAATARRASARLTDIDDLELESIAALGWRGTDHHRLGDWLLRAGGGWTGRANSVLPLGEPGIPLDEALANVSSWYAERGLTPQFQMPLPSRAALDAALADRGWTAYNPTWVLVATVSEAIAAAGPERANLPPVVITDSPTPQWLNGYHYRGGALPPIAHELLLAADQPLFGSISVGDSVMAVGRIAVDRGWVARRGGLARHLMCGLFTAAADHGATGCYLQVADDNTAALGLYERLGFTHHHRYHYRKAE
jgi:N-acetylglutamate synthase